MNTQIQKQIQISQHFQQIPQTIVQSYYSNNNIYFQIKWKSTNSNKLKNTILTIKQIRQYHKEFLLDYYQQRLHLYFKHKKHQQHKSISGICMSAAYEQKKEGLKYIKQLEDNEFDRYKLNENLDIKIKQKIKKQQQWHTNKVENFYKDEYQQQIDIKEEELKNIQGLAQNIKEEEQELFQFYEYNNIGIKQEQNKNIQISIIKNQQKDIKLENQPLISSLTNLQSQNLSSVKQKQQYLPKLQFNQNHILYDYDQQKKKLPLFDKNKYYIQKIYSNRNIQSHNPINASFHQNSFKNSIRFKIDPVSKDINMPDQEQDDKSDTNLCNLDGLRYRRSQRNIKKISYNEDLIQPSVKKMKKTTKDKKRMVKRNKINNDQNNQTKEVQLQSMKIQIINNMEVSDNRNSCMVKQSIQSYQLSENIIVNQIKEDRTSIKKQVKRIQEQQFLRKQEIQSQQQQIDQKLKQKTL